MEIYNGGNNLINKGFSMQSITDFDQGSFYYVKGIIKNDPFLNFSGKPDCFRVTGYNCLWTPLV